MEKGAISITDRIEAEILRFNQWREKLTGTVARYHDWLESSQQLDIQQSIRFYDLLENLNRGRLMLAFLAEFSRGKSELINALFFSHFNERLLPSDVGRTTMCPTEIFHDPSEEPYLRLLSVESRYREESIAQLKNKPYEWTRVRLNVNSSHDMREALKALAETKHVHRLEARMLGFLPPAMAHEMAEDDELVEIPVWRYATINFPHPLLTNGLSVLDTPGLNALGMEPELTLSTVPSAHAVLFLLSIDTGVTKSDLEIWERYVKPGLPQKIAVLNKIDLTWDDLKTQAEINNSVRRQVEHTAAALKLKPDLIFPVSAQKALLGRIRKDPALIAKSNIETLEKYLADKVIPARRQLLAKAVINELGTMMMSSKASLGDRMQTKRAEMEELVQLAGKSEEVVKRIWAKVNAEKTAYNNALAEFKVGERVFNQKRAGLMDMLNPARLDFFLSKARDAIDESWTTIGLTGGMNELFRLLSKDFDDITLRADDLKALMASLFQIFRERFGFKELEIAPLSLDGRRAELTQLVEETAAFCRDPVNVATPKNYLIRRFYASLVERARNIYIAAQHDCEAWARNVAMPITTQMRDHKSQIESRLASLKDISEQSGNINNRLTELAGEHAKLKEESVMIDELLAVVRAPFMPEVDPASAQEKDDVALLREVRSMSALDTATTTLSKAVHVLTGRKGT